MCDFVSWNELPDGTIRFLVAKDMQTKDGKKIITDAFGHEAIREYYGTGKLGIEKENRTFWDGNLPMEIIRAWNSGELDGMLQYLQTDDVEFVVKNAPDDFVRFVVQQRYPTDPKLMQEDSDSHVRRLGFMLDEKRDPKLMQEDSDSHVRRLGFLLDEKQKRPTIEPAPPKQAAEA